MAQFDFASLKREAQEKSDASKLNSKLYETLDVVQSSLLDKKTQTDALNSKIDLIETNILSIQKSQSVQGFYQVLTIANSFLLFVVITISLFAVLRRKYKNKKILNAFP